jgi:hypothetical protein
LTTSGCPWKRKRKCLQPFKKDGSESRSEDAKFVTELLEFRLVIEDSWEL